MIEKRTYPTQGKRYSNAIQPEFRCRCRTPFWIRNINYTFRYLFQEQIITRKTISAARKKRPSRVAKTNNQAISKNVSWAKFVLHSDRIYESGVHADYTIKKGVAQGKEPELNIWMQTVHFKFGLHRVPTLRQKIRHPSLSLKPIQRAPSKKDRAWCIVQNHRHTQKSGKIALLTWNHVIRTDKAKKSPSSYTADRRLAPVSYRRSGY